jgi:transcriptional regulator with XRE-family HTH domain
MRRKKKNNTLVILGTRIAKARDARDVSQEQLAEDAGIHRTHQGMVERGERNVTVLNLLRICTALKIKPGELLDELPPVPPKERQKRAAER